ncbi:DNA polymerase III subunit delta [Botrimarina hoheduenensis]|uniref:DNA-directed DNA polymerase n=1 Tax=Botrimarina hoheduenensis TaxID=2528000 RepID=A0A5C5VV51_9BACT|nr:DNA polymerase III subunit delta [Botrimarina hoheduenensis]TWT41539.1 DNA polymerase III subunit delta [Botrimarina hoheduenensis]
MAKSKPAGVTGLEYLLAPTTPTAALGVVSGDDGFVRHEVIAVLRERLVGNDDTDGGLQWHSFNGAEADWPSLADTVNTRSLFGGGKSIAYVDEADTFVTRYRDQLEGYAASPSNGVILLSVKSLPGNTRLAKRVAEFGLHVRCETPTRGPEVAKHRRSAARWLVERAGAEHNVELTAEAVELLFDRLPLNLGVLDQEVARLALLVGENRRIDPRLVDQEVGGWRTRTAWDMIDAAVEGRAADALTQLDRLLLAGEQPIGLLAQLSSTLRRFAAAADDIQASEQRGRRIGLQQALEAAGVVRFKLQDAERQLRLIGRARAMRLAEWTLEADLAMKGYDSSPTRSRVQLERLIVRLSREAVIPA